jgi:hypothetical protein
MEKARDSAMTDDDTVLDVSEQVNRPGDIAVQQQRIPAWHPILDPEWMIYSYLILAVIMIPLGTSFCNFSLYQRCEKSECNTVFWLLEERFGVANCCELNTSPPPPNALIWKVPFSCL